MTHSLFFVFVFSKNNTFISPVSNKNGRLANAKITIHSGEWIHLQGKHFCRCVLPPLPIDSTLFTGVRCAAKRKGSHWKCLSLMIWLKIYQVLQSSSCLGLFSHSYFSHILKIRRYVHGKNKTNPVERIKDWCRSTLKKYIY